MSGHLGSILGHVASSVGHLGSILRHLASILSHLRQSWLHLGQSWLFSLHLDPSWVPKASPSLPRLEQTIPRGPEKLPEPKSRKSGLVVWRHFFASATSEIHCGYIMNLPRGNPPCDVTNYSFNIVSSCSMMVNSMAFLKNNIFFIKTAHRAGQNVIVFSLKVTVF